jgi:CRP-like cAMP-binding protein
VNLLFASFDIASPLLDSWRLPVNLDPSAFVADPELISGLEMQSTPVVCHEDRVLFRQGDSPVGLYILKSGAVTLTMSTLSGKELVSIQALPGSLLGLPGIIGDEPYALNAVAHAGAHLSFLTRDIFTGLMRSDPSLAFQVLQVLAAEVRSARSALLDHGTPKAKRRRLTPSPRA